MFLFQVDGIAYPKELLAIMGSSGAGKTTLLNALNLRNTGNLKVQGVIKLNGMPVSSVEKISSVSCYVQQFDLFIGYLTVKEHLTFQVIKYDKTINI
jgi:ABC-type multidrug transport system ATPase subunit